jgi:1,4-alpha-glucan branching enzyme
LNTDAEHYGGSGAADVASVPCENVSMHGFDQSITLTLPPLATMILRPVG